jgi:large subunit ribosomal protein L24
MLKIRQNDSVIVLTGKDKGKRGTVLRNLGDKVVIEGINIVKKHQKPNPTRGEVGGVIDKAMPIQVSNVAIFNAATGKADRVGFKLLDDGRKVRFYKSTGEVIGA